VPGPSRQVPRRPPTTIDRYPRWDSAGRRSAAPRLLPPVRTRPRGGQDSMDLSAGGLRRRYDQAVAGRISINMSRRWPRAIIRPRLARRLKRRRTGSGYRQPLRARDEQRSEKPSGATSSQLKISGMLAPCGNLQRTDASNLPITTALQTRPPPPCRNTRCIQRNCWMPPHTAGSMPGTRDWLPGPARRVHTPARFAEPCVVSSFTWALQSRWCTCVPSRWRSTS